MDPVQVRILIVDDEPDILESFAAALREEFPSFDIVVLRSPSDALLRARQGIFDLVLSDYVMPEMDGIWFLSEVRRTAPSTRTVLVSAYWTRELAERAAEIGRIDRVIAKPVDVEVLARLVRDLLPDKTVATSAKE